MSKGTGSKLYNPNADIIPTRRTAEPEPLSDATTSSYVHVPRPHGAAQQREDRSSGPRQLFDHRKDDPVRFHAIARPPPSTPHTRVAPTTKLSGDRISASSGSSYAPSTSSSFTLSSTTDGSSASSKLFDGRPGAATDDSGTTAYADQLKRLYRRITGLETTVKQEDADADLMDDAMPSRMVLQGREPVSVHDEVEQEKWRKQIGLHKNLAETILDLLTLSLNPKVPASLRSIPVKYNIVIRLWTFAFNKLLENLRRASSQSPVALEHLQEFIYYAYTFYTGLLTRQSLSDFKPAWLEALGDLARYRMAVAGFIKGVVGQGGITTQALTEVSAEASATPSSTSLAVPVLDTAKSISDAPAARIDDSPSPSVGIVAARMMDLEPEKERWRNVARDWYGAGLTDHPGTGKLHHHLGLLSRDIESEELRGIYHFTKSMVSLHPFPTSRESILPMWSLPAQARRAVPDARASELFILLHGMIFTNIQLDHFQPTLGRFIERLKIEGAEEKEWIMMAIINISGIMEYGRPSGLLRKLGVVGPKEPAGTQQAATIRVMAKKAAAGVPGAVNPSAEDMMDVDGDQRRERDPTTNSPGRAEQLTPPYPNADLPDCPPGLHHALQLTFAMLSHVLQNPLRQPSAFARSTLNPYLTVILTFLATLLKQESALQLLERSIPWQELATFFTTIPRRVMTSQGLLDSNFTPDTGDRWVVTCGVSPPLAEDWCMRGMEWVGRKVFERGYWKSGEDQKPEMEILDEIEGIENSDGMIEDDDDEKDAPLSELERRWIRICRSAASLASTVDGFSRKEGTREWSVTGKLARKVDQWKEEDRLERLADERRRMGSRWTSDPMDVDEGDAEDASSESDDENDSEEIKALKARRRELKALLASGRLAGEAPRSRPRSGKRSTDTRPALNLVPGYTVLVVDTNILLSSLSMITSLVESMKWTVVVPLPVLMELDGLSSNVSPQLSEAATTAINYITSHIRTHSASLKVQTSKGNYLSSLAVRTEDVDFSSGQSNEKSMDDLILKAAIWQDDHWQDRSAMLKVTQAPQTTAHAVKVVLLTLDRNLRLKSRARQLPAAGEKDLAALMSFAT